MKRLRFVDSLYLFFMLSALALAFYKIPVHLNFVLLPLFFSFLGAVTYSIKPRKSLYLFFFLLPLVNALPDFFFNGYPYNYMSVILFYLSGLVVGSFVRKEKHEFHQPWARPYLLFLILLWISVLFLFLRWSNLGVSALSFGQDTPVTSAGERISFASIFPVVTLLLFSLSPFLPSLMEKNLKDRQKIFNSLFAGYTVSLLIGYYQKFIDPDFMAIAWWGTKLNQYNGGFSDFNAFGFFSGALFLYFVIALVNNESFKKAVQFQVPAVLLSLAGVFLSGCRTAFLFVLVALVFLAFTKKIKKRYKVVAMILFLVLLIIAGGTLKKRMAAMVDNIKQVNEANDLLDALDKVTNGRVAMMQRSVPLLKKYPLTGVGGGNFLFYLKHQYLGEKYWEDLPLNQYLLILDETGIIGFAIFLLFIIAILRQVREPIIKWLLAAILIAIFFNFFFWFPEILLFFWVIIALAETPVLPAPSLSRLQKVLSFAVIGIYLAANMFFFSALHPKTWVLEKSVAYDYGFWYKEKTPEGEEYQWTKSESGIFITLDKEGTSGLYRIFCGAPLDKLPNGSQQIDVYWQGKKFRSWNFNQNKEVQFRVSGQPAEEGFLEFKVSPVFNLKKLKISPESRDLGFQLYHPKDE